MFIVGMNYGEVQVKMDVCSSSPVRTPKLQLTAEEPLTGEGWIPPKKYAHGQRQRRSLSKMIGGAKLHLESNPIPTRDVWGDQTKPCASGDPTETEPDLPLNV